MPRTLIPTGQLRVYRKSILSSEGGSLQQGYTDAKSGELVWLDVPVVYGDAAPTAQE